jgi:integrase
VTELIHLKLSDIDPERMMIRVEQGKGKKDRYTIFSPRLLGELKKYKQAYQPVSWVFFGKNRNGPLDISAAQKVYNLAKQKSGLEKGKGIHTLRRVWIATLFLRTPAARLAWRKAPWTLLFAMESEPPLRRFFFGPELGRRRRGWR